MICSDYRSPKLIICSVILVCLKKKNPNPKKRVTDIGITAVSSNSESVLLRSEAGTHSHYHTLELQQLSRIKKKEKEESMIVKI